MIVLPGLRARLARRRDGESAPGQLASIGVEGADPTSGPHLAAGAFADPAPVPCRRGLQRQRRAVKACVFGDRRAGERIGRRRRLHFPDHLAEVAVERDACGYRRLRRKPYCRTSRPAIGPRLGNLRVIAPQRHAVGAASHVELHHPIPGVRDIHEAVVDQRGCLFLARQGSPVALPSIEKMNLTFRSLTCRG